MAKLACQLRRVQSGRGRDDAATGARASPPRHSVMTIAPGICGTPTMNEVPDEARQALEKSVPFPKRLGNPSEYAALAAHIIENGYLNGDTHSHRRCDSYDLKRPLSRISGWDAPKTKIKQLYFFFYT